MVANTGTPLENPYTVSASMKCVHAPADDGLHCKARQLIHVARPELKPSRRNSYSTVEASLSLLLMLSCAADKSGCTILRYSSVRRRTIEIDKVGQSTNQSNIP